MRRRQLRKEGKEGHTWLPGKVRFESLEGKKEENLEGSRSEAPDGTSTVKLLFSRYGAASPYANAFLVFFFWFVSGIHCLKE